MGRTAEIKRTTRETDISMKIALDGEGKSQIDTGIGFFNHMLEGFAKHGFFDLAVNIKGDLEVDGHHTVEDAGIVLGTAIRDAIRKASGVTAILSFRWTMHWHCAPLICAEDHT